MVGKFYLPFPPIRYREKDDMAVLVQSLWNGCTRKIGKGPGGEDTYLELFEFTPFKNETETDNNKEGKGKIPAESGAIAEKFGVSCLKNGPHSLQIHSIFGAAVSIIGRMVIPAIFSR